MQVLLTNGRRAWIDQSDWVEVRARRWRMIVRGPRSRSRTDYACCGRGPLMHRLILRAPDGVKVDHVDGDGLNNRRSNLRLASNQQNNQNARIQSNNTSGFKGVNFDASRGKFLARIKTGGRQRNLGRFDTAEAAAEAYDRAAVEAFGLFARTNASLGLLGGK